MRFPAMPLYADLPRVSSNIALIPSVAVTEGSNSYPEPNNVWMNAKVTRATHSHGKTS